MPLLLVVLSYLAIKLKTKKALFLGGCFIGVTVLSLGPYLTINGKIYAEVKLPYVILTHLKIFNQALPARLVLFASILAAIILGYFLTEVKVPILIKGLISVAILLTLFPNTNFTAADQSPKMPKVFSSKIFLDNLGASKTVLIFPYGQQGASQYYQVKDHLDFKIAEGDDVRDTPRGYGDDFANYPYEMF